MSTTKKDNRILLTDDPSAYDRREFLQLAGVGTAGMFAQKFTPAPMVEAPKPRAGSPAHVVVIGAGAWGGWTAYYLRRAGVKVTLVDQYGPANSRATSADETRGIRSSYGDRTEAIAPLWVKWARTSIARWHEFDAEWGPVFRTRFFVETGDVICRAADEPFVTKTRELWTKLGVKHEVMTGDEVRKRWPQMNNDDTTIAIYEPDAGVARARASTLAVAAIAEKMGATIRIGRVRPGSIVNNQMDGVVFDDGSVLRGDAYVFACGAWLRKIFQPLMTNRMRVPLGYVCYFATPAGDTRFTYPNMPSYNFPGVTGWVTLPVDSRGFRVRGAIAPPAPPGATPAPGAAGPAGRAGGAGNTGTAGATGAAGAQATTGAAGAAGGQGQRQGGGGGGQAQPQDPTLSDPDLSSRWMSQERIDGSRRFVARRFPDLKDAPLSETRACHYESSVNRNFIIDHVPGADNAWIAGVGQAEGFKFGPVVGEYVAMRVLGNAGDPELVKAFKMPTEEYET
ncbi:MAG: FAD-dependent oxidoreductase [Acidobacteria bacterium]|nr:MAG: FAD-dependent oxidoreductase [Acidobacteriota bacterium]